MINNAQFRYITMLKKESGVISKEDEKISLMYTRKRNDPSKEL